MRIRSEGVKITTRSQWITFINAWNYSLSIPTSLSIASRNLRGREVVVAFPAN